MMVEVLDDYTATQDKVTQEMEVRKDKEKARLALLK